MKGVYFPAMTRLPTAALFLPACFIAEVVLGGPKGVYGGISFRFVLLGASCATLLFALLVRGRVARPHLAPILSILGFLALNGIWVAFVPVLTGTDMHWAIREPHAFVVLIPVLLTLALLRPEELDHTVLRLQQLVVVASLILAVFQVGVWLVGTLMGGLQWMVSLVLGAIYPGAGDDLKVGAAPDGFFRVFWISTLWCLLAFFWVPVAFRSARLQWLSRALLVLDLFVAYSRGIWVGLVGGLLLVAAVTVTRRTLGRTLVRSAALGAVTAGLLLGIVTATGELERGVARVASTASRSDESIGARLEQSHYLLELWYEHPIVGSGYGAYVPGHVRSPDVPYSYEHMPYALLAKLGLMGVLASGLFFAGWAITAWQARRAAPVQVASFLGACTALLVAEMTNPLVLNFVSMSIFACLLLQWASLVSASEPMRGSNVQP